MIVIGGDWQWLSEGWLWLGYPAQLSLQQPAAPVTSGPVNEGQRKIASQEVAALSPI